MILLYAAALWFGVTGCYVLVTHAAAIRKAGRLNLFWTINVLPWAVVGIVLDALFNATVGTLMYLELPREALFTARCKRHVSSDDWRGGVARWWQRQLNQIEPGHV